MKSLPYAAPNQAVRIGNRPLVGVSASHCGQRCAALIAWIFLVVFSMENLHAQTKGIVIYKESTAHPDGSARVFEYRMVSKMGAITRYFTSDGRIDLNQFQPQTAVAYPDLMTRAITDPSQLGPIENGDRAYREIIARYPQAAGFLSPHIKASDDIIRRVKGGEVLFNGEWIMRSEYEAMIQREDDRAKEHGEKSREKKRVVEEQARRLELETRRHKR